jgi:hypothetical protein
VRLSVPLKKYAVRLTPEERESLVALTRKGRASARRIRRERWTMQLVADKLVELRLCEQPCNPWQPVVCFDAKPVQLLAETRVPGRRPLVGHVVTTMSTSAKAP